MRILYLVLLLSLPAVGAYAQTSPGSSDVPNVIVIKKQWSFQVRNPALDESPFIEIEERLQAEQDLRENAAENRRRAGLGLKPVRVKERPRTERNEGSASAKYVYQIKVKNAGEKTIRELILEYVFFDPNTELEIARLRFMSKKEIAPSKTKDLVFRMVSSPTGTVNAKDTGKKSRELYSEQVIIQSVIYKDGSKWNAAPKNQ